MSELLKDIETFLTNMHKVPPEFVPPKAEALRKRVQAARAQGGEAVGFIPDSGLNNLNAGHAAKIYPVGCMPSPFEGKTLVYAKPAPQPDKWVPTIDWAVKRCQALQQQGFERVRLDVLESTFRNAIEASRPNPSGEGGDNHER